MIPYREYRRPYIITIINSTDKKLENIEVFNSNYQSQKDIKYSCPISNVEYDELINHKNGFTSIEFSIKLITCLVSCNDENIKKQQLNSFIETIVPNIFGQKIIKRFKLRFSAANNDYYITDIDFPFFDKASMILEYLMPKTTVEFCLFQPLNKTISESIRENIFEIWLEGFSATGESEKAKFFGIYYGEDFKAACKDALISHKWDMSCYDEEKNTYWGCYFYDNEKDARESFG